MNMQCITGHCHSQCHCTAERCLIDHLLNMAISFATLLIALESTHTSKCCSASNWMSTIISLVDLFALLRYGIQETQLCDTEGSREPKYEKSRKCSQCLGSDQESWRYSVPAWLGEPKCTTFNHMKSYLLCV